MRPVAWGIYISESNRVNKDIRRVNALTRLASKVPISFSPGFSPVLAKMRRWLTVLTVCLILNFKVLRTPAIQEAQSQKPLKRLPKDNALNTGLKPGENEIKTFEAKPGHAFFVDFEVSVTRYFR